MVHVLAILETMWGPGGGQAARYFRINPKNFSGRRLYSLIGSGNSLIVTNACRELVNASHKHGTPDPVWLCENLTRIHTLKAFDVILICGKVAQATYKQSKFIPQRYTRVIEIPHPAARGLWNKEFIESVKLQIQGVTK